MDTTKPSNQGAVAMCFIFTALIGGINAPLLNQHNSTYGLYCFFSFVVSSLGIIPSLISVFIKSSLWLVRFTKVTALSTFASQGFVEQHDLLSSSIFFDVYCFLNIALVILSVVSVALIISKTKLNEIQ